MKKTFFYLTVGLLMFWMGGCFPEPEEPADFTERDEQLIQEYLTSNGISAIKHSSGLHYVIEEEGTQSKDSIIFNTAVVLHYEGRLLDGSLFDSSKARGVPAAFTPQGLIFGWQIALPLLNRGSKAQLFIPSHLGYGNQSTGSIPANSVLIFDIEVIDFFPAPFDADTVQSVVDKEAISMYLERENITDAVEISSGIYYQKLEEGSGSESPAGTDSVRINFSGELINGEEFHSSNDGESRSFKLGEQNIISGWTIGIQQMKKGEKAKFIIPSISAFGSRQDLTIPPNSVVIYEIELLDFGF